MGITKNDLMELVTILSNENYGDVIYTTKYNSKHDIFDVYIKDCSSRTIEDLRKKSFNLEMSSKGLHVYRFN